MMYGKIDLGFHSQIFVYLSGGDYSDSVDFEFWDTHKHPAVKEFTAQSIIFEWGSGVKYGRDKSRIRLCSNCQKALIKLVGGFFHFDMVNNNMRRAEIIKLQRLVDELKGNKEALCQEK